MGTEVLIPQDLFADRFNNISPTPPFRIKKAKKSVTKKAAKKSFVNGQVTLLRRGEPLDSIIITKSKFANPNPGPISTVADRIGPESPLRMVPKQIRLPAPSKIYAGSVIATLSPSPRALPKPSFCKDDFATRDLRRLLRLD